MPFISQPLAIPDVVLIEPKVFLDKRGFFLEVYKKNEFKDLGIAAGIDQINHSKSCKNVLRGLHYQKEPFAQTKLVCVVSGAIFDVAVDIRQGSPSFGKWVSAELTSDNKKMLFIPKGFAHGFCVLSDTAEIEYYCSGEYAPKEERGIKYDDPTLNIAWPIDHPIISDKDAKYPGLKDADNNFIHDKK